jgi:hypothetical protein
MIITHALIYGAIIAATAVLTVYLAYLGLKK